MIQDFDELLTSSGINLNEDGWDLSLIGGLDAFLPGRFSAEKCQTAFSISARGSSSWALNDIPWFRFQQLIKTTGSYAIHEHQKWIEGSQLILGSRAFGLQPSNEPSLSLTYAKFRHAFDLPGSRPW